MRFSIKKRFSLVLFVALALVLAIGIGFSAANVAYADGTAIKKDSLKIGHMSDVHYFPIEHCYRDVNNADYKLSDFYHSMTGDTKLVLESGLLLNYVVNEVINMAKQGTAPQYMVASGDLCKNGERVALIDVANSLRYMQNMVRREPGYENFQVLAIVGNHDLYNTDGALYTQNGGQEKPADIISAAQFALIFAGLGFPNAAIPESGDVPEGFINLTDYLPAEYWSSEFTDGYQRSENAKNLTFTYYNEHLNAVSGASDEEKLAQYFEIGDAINQLSYAVEIEGRDYGFIIFDSTDREAVEDGAPIRVSKEEYDVIKKPGTTTSLYLESDGYVNLRAVGESAAQSAFEAGRAVYRRSPYAHITGGRLKEETLDWAEQYINAHPAAELGEKSFVVSFHHNLLPHFDQEDDILKDFTLYNWEYAAKRFLGMGVRYALTGHQHSSDVVTYTDAEGRTLYDFETGSAVSYESPRRYVEITRYDCAGKLGEGMTSSLVATSSLAKLKSSHIVSGTDEWDAEADKLMSEYKAAKEKGDEALVNEKWAALVAAYPSYLAYMIKYDDLNSYNYNEYISKDIYAILVDRVIDHFLTDDLFEGLGKTVGDMIRNIDSDTVNLVLGMLFGDKETLAGMLEYAIDTALFNLYPDTDEDGVGNYLYTHPNGVTDSYNGIKDYLLAIVNDLIFGVKGYTDEDDFMLFGDSSIKSEVNPANAGKMCLRDMASFIMEAHTVGVEIALGDSFDDYDAKYTEKAFGEDEEFGFKNPLDKTYRKRMLAAVRDAHDQLISGKFADDLFNALLDPLFVNENSLIKTLLDRSFDFTDAVEKEYLAEYEFDRLQNIFGTTLPSLLAPSANGEPSQLISLLEGLLKTKIDIPQNFSIPSFDMTDFSLGALINALVPIVKPLVANMLGFGLVGDDLVSILNNAIAGYITDSFKVGLGGIADNIVMAYATDVYPDMSDFLHPETPYDLQPHEGYEFGGKKLSYLSTLNEASSVGADFNAATQLNGRVPSRLTANFDTVSGEDTYTFKFYTAEDVYATFKFATDEELHWNEVTTSKAKADARADYFDSESYDTFDGVEVDMLTQTVPAYVPLIDLGLAALTHGEISYEDEDGNEIPFKYGDRDNSPKNSVIYYNVTTVTVSGLEPGRTYYYDLEGSYVASNGETARFSYVDFAKLKGYDKDYYTFTTAKAAEESEFEFLTIADIQGMIQGMYDDSYKAVSALLADERTKNFDFVLNAGDMVDNGKNFSQWEMALDTYQNLFANTSQFFAAGNHEDGKNAFATYFNYTLPTDEEGDALQADITDGAFYSFDYANSHFTVLNTNDLSTNGLGEVQLAWLENDLKNAAEKQWRFVLMHKSIFSGGSHSKDAEVIAMRTQLVPLFKRYNVNIVFGGHDHTYTVTNLVKEDGKVEAGYSFDNLRYAGDGVLYVTLGTLGTKFYEYSAGKEVTSKFNPSSSIMHTLDSQTFGKVKVTENEIVFTGYYYDRETDSLKVIGKPINLTTNSNLIYASDVIFWAVIAFVALIIIGVIVTIIVTSVLVRRILNGTR